MSPRVGRLSRGDRRLGPERANAHENSLVLEGDPGDPFAHRESCGCGVGQLDRIPDRLPGHRVELDRRDG